MTRSDLRRLAQQSAESCRDKKHECLYRTGAKSLGLAPKDCPMRPTPCCEVTADMWYRDLYDRLSIYSHIEEEDMLMPTEENDGEFWWLQEVQTGKCHVVQIWADEFAQKTHGSPVFFWAGNEVEEPVNRPDITWLGKVEPPKEG